MSKFLFPPQIQQLRAANAGQIALADSGVHMIGVSKFTIAAQLVGKSIVLALVSALGTVTITANQTPTVSRTTFTEVASLVTKSISLSIVSALETPTFPAGESPVVGVAIFTDVF